MLSVVWAVVAAGTRSCCRGLRDWTPRAPSSASHRPPHADGAACPCANRKAHEVQELHRIGTEADVAPANGPPGTSVHDFALDPFAGASLFVGPPPQRRPPDIGTASAHDLRHAPPFDPAPHSLDISQPRHCRPAFDCDCCTRPRNAQSVLPHPSIRPEMNRNRPVPAHAPVVARARLLSQCRCSCAAPTVKGPALLPGVCCGPPFFLHVSRICTSALCAIFPMVLWPQNSPFLSPFGAFGAPTRVTTGNHFGNHHFRPFFDPPVTRGDPTIARAQCTTIMVRRCHWGMAQCGRLLDKLALSLRCSERRQCPHWYAPAPMGRLLVPLPSSALFGSVSGSFGSRHRRAHRDSVPKPCRCAGPPQPSVPLVYPPPKGLPWRGRAVVAAKTGACLQGFRLAALTCWRHDPFFLSSLCPGGRRSRRHLSLGHV